MVKPAVLLVLPRAPPQRSARERDLQRATQHNAGPAIAVPFWLMADPRPGTAGTDGVTVTLSPSQQASKLAPRAYEAPVTFTNLTDGQGTTRRTAKLTVLRSATPSQGFLLDESGAHLRDNRGERRIAR